VVCSPVEQSYIGKYNMVLICLSSNCSMCFGAVAMSCTVIANYSGQAVVMDRRALTGRELPCLGAVYSHMGQHAWEICPFDTMMSQAADCWAALPVLRAALLAIVIKPYELATLALVLAFLAKLLLIPRFDLFREYRQRCATRFSPA
jgi:hypothetical protein